jgi:ABC-2 type transport system ATP-binding protein
MGPIRVDRVSKRFEKTQALDAVSFEVRPGEVFGLLGPNGAGKTTLIRAILDIIKPDSGRIEIFGRPFRPEDRERCGYLPEERGLYPRQPVGAVLEYLGRLKGLGADAARAGARKWLDRLGLADAAAKKVEQLSKGNQQKVQMAAALVASPPILILDEPHSGLDPVSVRMVNGVIRECAAGGQTVVLSTHQMNLVEALCTRVIMIARGQTVLYGDLQEIKREYSADAIRIQSNAIYGDCPLVERVDANGNADRSVNVYLQPTATGDEFLSWLVARGAHVDSFERLSTPLEEIFVHLAEHAERTPSTSRTPGTSRTLGTSGTL